MDRNLDLALHKRGSFVALRKESVDRNNDTIRKKEINPAVALRKESVDRNSGPGLFLCSPLCVALRKESVDRNDQQHLPDSTHRRGSLSARRAWIEIPWLDVKY